MIITFVEDTRLGGTANKYPGRQAKFKMILSIEHWAENNRMKLNRDKCKVLHLGKRIQMHSYSYGGYLAQQYYK